MSCKMRSAALLWIPMSMMHFLSSAAFVIGPRNASFRTNPLAMTTVPPSDASVVGILGRGYVSVLTAKISASAGYNTWMVCPPGQEATVLSLIDDSCEAPSNLELVPGSDSDLIESRMMETNALIIAVDDDSTMDEGVVNYLLSPEVAKNLKRVVAMSRNLNGKGMGLLVKAAKMSANSEVWDGSTSAVYKKFEENLKKKAAACGAQYTIARAGTLKGGACGEKEHNQFLTTKYYEMTKKDIVTWQLLFDCNVRGVKLAKGDVLPGPGGRAVFTATGTDELPGDTSRSGIAEAMVKSLEFENTGDTDFGVATAQSRDPPTDDQWKQLFHQI